MAQFNWQSICRTGVARADITPPVRIYHRMWGAAKHDRSEGVHRPLTATCLVFTPLEESSDECQVVLAVDHCLLEAPEVDAILELIEERTHLPRERVAITFSHTHAAGLMSRARKDLPGGDMIGPYLDGLRSTLAQLVEEAKSQLTRTHWTYGVGRCPLAANRDFVDPETGESVCGNNPEPEADETVVVGRAVDESGRTLATMVNYACHPTTLAWDNRLISPDYPGAMREVVESVYDAPCVFLQGASGDLGPVEGFVGDCEVADRNGRQLGFAALCALESAPRPLQEHRYQGPVVSGATIGAWAWEDVGAEREKSLGRWQVERTTIPLAYREELPTVAQVDQECQDLEREETSARQDGNDDEAQRLRALAERKRRMRERLSGLPAGPDYPFAAPMWRVGDAIWVCVQGEPYNCLQQRLREALPDTPIIIATITNGWGPSYLPPRELYGKGVYQESIAALAPGTLEQLTDELIQRATTLMNHGGEGVRV